MKKEDEVTITRSTPYEELPEWMTIKEVAIYDNRDYQSLKNAFSYRNIPYKKVRKSGGSWRIHKSDFSPDVKRTFK